MNIAKLSRNGQITVPVEIRRLLGLKAGDKILFLQNESGEVFVSNASASATRKAQLAFAGASDMIGVKNDEDVQILINDLRRSGSTTQN